MTPKYFRLAVVSNNGEEILKVGNKVFENHSFGIYEGLSNNGIFINAIFSFLANHNLEVSEQELIDRGFMAIDTKGLPKDLLEKIPYLLCDKNYEKNETALSREEGIELLNRNLPLITESLISYLKRK